MARGEPTKDRSHGAALAIGAIGGALCLASLTLVATCSDTCVGFVPASWMHTPPPPEPFFQAHAAIEQLGWRDADRARARHSAPVGPDASAARRALDVSLTSRGYVRVLDETDAAPLPLERTVDALDGACGVVAVLGVGNAMLLTAEGPGGAVEAADQSAITIAACGSTTVRANGTGVAAVAAWQLPGITPADVRATELPVEVVLAHAEAEVLWRRQGWVPVDEVIVERRPAGPTTVTPPAGVVPASDCIAWVGVAIGDGFAVTSGGLVVRDFAPDRALFGGASCASGTRTSTRLEDRVAGDGSVVYWRAWGAGPAGPARSAAGSGALSAGALRVVTESAATLPAVAFPETAP